MHTQTGIYKAEGKKNTSKIFHLNFSLLNRARYELGKNSRILNVNLSFPFFKLFCLETKLFCQNCIPLQQIQLLFKHS